MIRRGPGAGQQFSSVLRQSIDGLSCGSTGLILNHQRQEQTVVTCWTGGDCISLDSVSAAFHGTPRLSVAAVSDSRK